jgi:hypothetical protein
MREAYFHEDDYCQIEILPLDNLGFCLKQAETIADFSEAHRSGIGWDAMYMREENPSKLASMGITINALRRAIFKEMPEYDALYTGYSSYKEKCKKTFAFGNDNMPILFAETTENEVISAMWCSDPMQSLTLLPCSDRLLLADWGWSFICPIQDQHRLVEYLNERERSIIEFREKMERDKRAKDEVSAHSNTAKWWKFW